MNNLITKPIIYWTFIDYIIVTIFALLIYACLFTIIEYIRTKKK